MSKPKINHKPYVKPDPADSVFQPGRLVHARKQYSCCECFARIFEHDEYELFSGKFKADGDDKDDADHDGRVWKTFRTCHRCFLARRRLKELLPREQHPRRGDLALAIQQYMKLDYVTPSARIIKAFTNSHVTDGGL